MVPALAHPLAHLLAAVLTVLLAAPGPGQPGYPARPGPSGSRPGPSAAVWPLSPAPDVVAGFDPPAEEWGAGHRGVDLLGAAGQTVRAAAAGTVTFAGMLAGRGVVVVDHGGTRTTYEPVEAGVRVGDRVAAGDPIGRLGRFGSHCWPRSCLHWGLIAGARYLDPLSLVGAGPVRLLPLLSPVPAAARRLPVNRLTAAERTGAATTSAAAALRFVRPAGAPAGTPDATGPW